MIDYRAAIAEDAAAIASLHADSWRRAYRGIYSDEFLDNDVFDDRLAEWSKRFAHPAAKQRTTVAEVDGELVGFVHTSLDDDPKWGALLDNLHVRAAQQGSGIGKRLMAESARAVVDQASGSALYLWVLEKNVAAQAFYDARGGMRAERVLHSSPDGAPAAVFRYVWPDPANLL
jgi:ribosomal protein S18 acetylase RimI-like enzyme